MSNRKLPYRDGDWFLVPLASGGFASGIVARMDGKGTVLGYFFGPRHESMPDLREVSHRHAGEAILLAKFGDLGLLRGKWRIIGNMPTWSKADWPIPPFVRIDVLSGVARKIVYREPDLRTEAEAQACSADEAAKLPRDGSWGAAAVEAKLEALLSQRSFCG